MAAETVIPFASDVLSALANRLAAYEGQGIGPLDGPAVDEVVAGAREAAERCLDTASMDRTQIEGALAVLGLAFLVNLVANDGAGPR